MENFFENELKEMFGNSPVLYDGCYAGKIMLAKLDRDLRVKLEFAYTCNTQHYTAIRCTIINRVGGTVDTSLFEFKDLYEQAPGNNKYDKYEIWDYAYPAWRPEIPIDTKRQIAKKVLDYVAVYQQDVSAVSAI